MLGLSIQYSYEAINIHVMKYSSTFLSKYKRIPFFSFRYLKYIDELIKNMQTISHTVSYALGDLEGNHKFCILTT